MGAGGTRSASCRLPWRRRRGGGGLRGPSRAWLCGTHRTVGSRDTLLGRRPGGGDRPLGTDRVRLARSFVGQLRTVSRRKTNGTLREGIATVQPAARLGESG